LGGALEQLPHLLDLTLVEKAVAFFENHLKNGVRVSLLDVNEAKSLVFAIRCRCFAVRGNDQPYSHLSIPPSNHSCPLRPSVYSFPSFPLSPSFSHPPSLLHNAPRIHLSNTQIVHIIPQSSDAVATTLHTFKAVTESCQDIARADQRESSGMDTCVALLTLCTSPITRTLLSVSLHPSGSSR
jgi:hypothetical protein